jgi:signal transduction histidine kinase
MLRGMARVEWVAAGVVTVLAPWYGEPAALRFSAWTAVLAATLAFGFARLARLPLAIVSATVSVGGSVWAWRSLAYGFLDAGADSDKVLLWTTVEVGGLTALGLALARTAAWSARLSAWLLLLPGAAVGIRLLPHGTATEQLFLGLLGAAAVLSAILLGLYLGGLDQARMAAIAQARADQRRSLASDLHDYVAHDIAGIAVAAQAVRIVGPADGTMASMEQIERAATRALQRLDRSIRLLRDDPDRTAPQYGLADMPELVAACPFPVELTVTVEAPHDIPAAVQATAYRVISEALTNVARHAQHGCHVRVSATRRRGELEVVVSNDLPRGTTRTRGASSGTGLANLRAQVEALDGTMCIGADPGSWQVRATLPID